MRNVLELKIEDWWAVLAPDTSISIEMTSPLWNDSGTFSYTFQLPYSANRHIFNASDKPESDVNLKNFRKRFELYLYGIGFLFGDIVCTSDEIDTDADRVDVEIRSANATFEDAIDGKSLRDLDLGEVKIGSKISRNRAYQASIQIFNYGEYQTLQANRTWLPYEGFYETFENRHNASTVYPSQKYINIPIIVNGLENGDSNKKKPLYLSPYRAYSSPCFFISHLLDVLFRQYSFHVQRNEWNEIEDLRRMIVLNTRYAYSEKELKKEVVNGIHRYQYTYHSFEATGTGEIRYANWPYTEWTTHFDLVASNQNLPDTGLKEFIDSLKAAFGLRILTDNDNQVKLLFLKNIFRSTEVKKLHFKNVYDVNKRHLINNGIILKYGQDEGEEYKYNDYKSVKAYDNYESLLNDWTILKNDNSVNEYTNRPLIEEDTLLRIDKETGNFYRTKVDKDKFDNAQLFEVAQFIEYKADGSASEDKPEEISIGFSPVIPTGINHSEFVSFTTRPIPTEAFFVDTEINYNHKASEILELKDAADGADTGVQTSVQEDLKDLLDFDCGFTVGIVRTSPEGSLSENYTETMQDVDGFGNSEWVRTLCTTTVTSDSVSRDGRLFDYNGTDEGIGAPMEQLVSLKLWNGKQNFDPSTLAEMDNEGNTLTGADVYNNNPTGPLPNRGLVPQFQSEYLHFRKYRKPISVTGDVHISELVNIEWDKYHDVAGYRGLLNKIKFSVSMNGISEVTVEHYII